MKYQPPTEGPYESGLTARLMYDEVDTLINRHISADDIAKARSAISENPYDFNSINLWRKPRIKRELEEFVRSYFFSEFYEQLPDFEEVFIEDNIRQEEVTENELLIIEEKQKKRLETYVTVLEQEYGSRDEAYKVISEAFGKILKHKDKIFEIQSQVDNIDGDLLIKGNAIEAFAHIPTIIYGNIDFAMRYVGIKPQS